MSPLVNQNPRQLGGWMGVGTEASQPMDVTGGKKKSSCSAISPTKTNSENMIRNTAFKPMLLFCSQSPNKNINFNKD